MPEKPYTVTGLRRIWNACFYCRDGLLAAWKHEAAFRQESIFIGAAILLMIFTPLPLMASWPLLASALFVWVVELLNSGLEALVDLVSPEWHVLAKRAKDCGSAAVMLSLCIMAMIWCAILLPPLLSFSHYE